MRRIVIIVNMMAIAGLTIFGCANKQHSRDEARQRIPNSESANIDTENPKPEFTGLRRNIQNDDLSYVVREKQNRTIVKGELEKAKSIEDLIPNYPSSWITDYVSVEVTTISNGETRTAASPNDILSREQKELLQSAKMSADLIIDVKYKSKNGANNKMETNEMNVLMTVIPDVQAKYIGGYEVMIQYLKENSKKAVSKIKLEQFQQLTVTFTVNEQGSTENARMIQASGNAEVDQLLMDVLHGMPKWKPAENSKGEQVKQDFELRIGSGFDC